MSAAVATPPRATIAGRWQAAVFLAGAAVFGLAIHRMAANHHPLTFKDELHRAHLLSEAGALTRLNAYLIHLLKDVKRPAHERGEIHRLLVGAIHRAETECETHDAEYVTSIISNFDKAVAFGATPTGSDWLALADAYLWSGRQTDGVDALRQALRVGASKPDSIRRRLFEIETACQHSAPDEAMHDLDAIIEDENASSSNFAWAVERKIQWLLRKGETNGAMTLIESAKRRLRGRPERPTLIFAEALCLRSIGRLDEADAMLRSLRDSLEDRDELWGRAGWLLGEMELADGRPQSAVAFFDDVQEAFSKGPLFWGCELGRAMAMIALARKEVALGVLADIRDMLLESGDSEYVELNAVRTTLTTVGRSLLTEGRRETGVRYLELALSLVAAEDDAPRIQLLSQIAAGLRAEADALEVPGAAPDDVERSQSLRARAAEASMALARIESLDPFDSAEALERAADDLDRAGEIVRMIDVLSTYVDRFTADQVEAGRARVLVRLARAHQARGELREAIDAYEQVIRQYPRQPEALESMVPRASCLLRLGGDDAKRGESLLLEIVDDLGAEPLFTPAAQEYRDALIMLAEHYVFPDLADTANNDPKDEEARLTMGITRLEDALALYPTDSRVPRLKFFLAEAYRRSADAARAKTGATDHAARREIESRMRSAYENYLAVKERLAREDVGALTLLEQTYLRASYLYLGDCLFDLGEIERAVEAYREAAWRYENEPAAVAAMMQVVNGYFRMGRSDDARAALARMKWLLKKIPDEAFTTVSAMTPKSYWEDMVMRLERTDVN